jgi:hypothetical protein
VARVALPIGLYIAAGLAFAISVNADQQNFAIAVLFVAVAAITSGWAVGNCGFRSLPGWILLPWIVVLVALPFGTTEKFTGGDDLSPVALVAVVPALLSTVLMALAAGARGAYEHYRRRTTR